MFPISKSLGLNESKLYVYKQKIYIALNQAAKTKKNNRSTRTHKAKILLT